MACVSAGQGLDAEFRHFAKTTMISKGPELVAAHLFEHAVGGFIHLASEINRVNVAAHKFYVCIGHSQPIINEVALVGWCQRRSQDAQYGGAAG